MSKCCQPCWVNVNSFTALVDAISWYSALLLALMLLMLCCCVEMSAADSFPEQVGSCEEIYVVREGETLHTISDKCGDPYIVEENPHIHDPDDVFPGLVIKITPFKNAHDHA